MPCDSGNPRTTISGWPDSEVWYAIQRPSGENSCTPAAFRASRTSGSLWGLTTAVLPANAAWGVLAGVAIWAVIKQLGRDVVVGMRAQLLRG